MASHDDRHDESLFTETDGSTANLRVALILAALAAVGAAFAISQILERRLSKPEIARLKFYRYLRERGHLES